MNQRDVVSRRPANPAAAHRQLPLTLGTYRLLAAAMAPLAGVLLNRRLKRGREHPVRLPERRGISSVARPSGALVWLHGASVGEVASIIPLVERILAKDFNVLVTSGTVTSAKLAEQRLPPGAIHQFVPLDSPPFVRRFLQHWQPDLALFTESDLWPNMIVMTSERDVPLILLNARLSERSFKRWRSFPLTAAALLRRFDACLVQSSTYAERYLALGAPHIATTGNLKLDVPEPPADHNKFVALKAAVGMRPTIAAASTHAGEEAAIIETHMKLRARFPNLLTLIAPRHPDRGLEVAQIAKTNGLSAKLRSQGNLPAADDDIYVVDTLGELGLVYRLAPIVFVGGSWVTHGGQNPIEPIKLGAAVLHGPHVWNFAEIYSALDTSRGAVLVNDVGQLVSHITELLSHQNDRAAVVSAARQTVQMLGGALDRTLTAIEPYLLRIILDSRGRRA